MNTLKQLIPARWRMMLGRRRYQAKKIAVRRDLLNALPRQSVGAEIGVHEGDLSAEVLAIVRPATFHLIDPWAYQPAYADALFGAAAARDAAAGKAAMEARYEQVCARFAAEIASGQVVIHRATSHDIAADFDDAYFDWVYIDGNHLYDYVKQDLEDYYPKVKPGGALLGDDYNTVGWWQDGVTQAVDEFVAARGLDLTVIGSQFVIRKPLRASNLNAT
jgi:hypothetical protein